MGMKIQPAAILLLLLVVATTLPIPKAFADRPRRSSSSYGDLNNSTPNGGNTTRTAIGRRASPQTLPQTPSNPRSLLPPAGSATNVRPGFYQRLNAPPSQPRGHGHQTPYVVYVPTQLYDTQPYDTQPHHVVLPSIHTVQNVPSTPPLDRVTEIQPQPVYVVNPPSDTRSPQPVYIVNPNAGGSPTAGVPAVQPATPKTSTPPPSPPSAAPRIPVEVEYRIAPADAKVYLDDELLGTGSDLIASSESLMLDPGVHVLEVTHPEHRSQRVVFGVSSNEPVKVAVDLTTERIGRRSRVH